MAKIPSAVILTILVLLGSYLALAQQPAPQNLAQQNPQQLMTFFVTSVGIGKGGDLGGLAGADRHCQVLATAVGAGNHTWHAYLSTQASSNQPAVNARDRIGQGPWYNAKGARLGNNLGTQTALTEKGQIVNGIGDAPGAVHDVLTGSQTDGRAYTDSADHTCRNWTSSGSGSAQVSHSDRNGGGNTSWNSAHPSRAGCSQEGFVPGGLGLSYCFAIN